MEIMVSSKTTTARHQIDSTSFPVVVDRNQKMKNNNQTNNHQNPNNPNNDNDNNNNNGDGNSDGGECCTCCPNGGIIILPCLTSLVGWILLMMIHSCNYVTREGGYTDIGLYYVSSVVGEATTTSNNETGVVEFEVDDDVCPDWSEEDELLVDTAWEFARIVGWLATIGGIIAIVTVWVTCCAKYPPIWITILSIFYFVVGILCLLTLVALSSDVCDYYDCHLQTDGKCVIASFFFWIITSCLFVIALKKKKKKQQQPCSNNIEQQQQQQQYQQQQQHMLEEPEYNIELPPTHHHHHHHHANNTDKPPGAEEPDIIVTSAEATMLPEATVLAIEEPGGMMSPTMMPTAPSEMK